MRFRFIVVEHLSLSPSYSKLMAMHNPKFFKIQVIVFSVSIIDFLLRVFCSQLSSVQFIVLPVFDL